MKSKDQIDLSSTYRERGKRGKRKIETLLIHVCIDPSEEHTEVFLRSREFDNKIEKKDMGLKKELIREFNRKTF